MATCYGLSDVYPRPKCSHNAYLHVKGIEELRMCGTPRSPKPILPWTLFFHVLWFQTSWVQIEAHGFWVVEL